MTSKLSSLADAYSVLGLDEDASLENVKSAYKQLALRTHPDKNPDNEQATEQFQRLSEAYNLLLRRLERPSSQSGRFFSFGGHEYDDDDDDYYYEEDEDILLYYKFIFEEVMRGHAHHGGRRFYRRETPETPEQYQARMKRSREEQIVAEERRKKEEVARKAKLEKERQRERKEVEERHKQKASKKKAKAQAQRMSAEQTARNELQRVQMLRSAVFAAARSGDAAKVKKGIWEDAVDAAGGEIRNGCVAFVENPPADHSETLLHIAAKAGDAELVKWLDTHNADPEERNGEGLSAFHIALRHGHLPILNHFFETYPPKEPDSNAIYILHGSISLLSLALDSNEPEMVWLILDKGLANTEDIGKIWARVSPSEGEEKTRRSAKDRGKLDEIRKVLMTFGGFTPPNTPRDSPDLGGQQGSSKQAGSDDRTGRGMDQHSGTVKQSRSPQVHIAPEQQQQQSDGTRKAVNQNRGRGRGKGRGKGRGRGKGTV